jgi:hypothetical protein
MLTVLTQTSAPFIGLRITGLRVVTLATQPELMQLIRAKASPMRSGTTSSQGWADTHHCYLMKYPDTRHCASLSRVGVIVSTADRLFSNEVSY